MHDLCAKYQQAPPYYILVMHAHLETLIILQRKENWRCILVTEVHVAEI